MFRNFSVILLILLLSANSEAQRLKVEKQSEPCLEVSGPCTGSNGYTQYIDGMTMAEYYRHEMERAEREFALRTFDKLHSMSSFN